MFSILELEQDLQKFIPNGSIELPPILKFGHVAFNGLMINKSPEIKTQILQYLDSIPYIEKYEIVGSGFLNIFFKPNLDFIIEKHNFGQDKKIHIEYCSPNPTGDLHLGHCRNIIIGFCVSNLLKIAGFNVTTEMYINDQGNQMNQFIETIKWWKNKLLNGEEEFQIYYKGDYVELIAQQLLDKEINRDNVIKILMNQINSTLTKMNISFDHIIAESSLYKEMEEVKKILLDRDLLFYGELENQKTEGKHLILKTSVMGLDYDTVLQRENGQFTYFAFDIAYHYNKKTRGFSNQICVLGEDHASHIDKLQTVLKYSFDIDLVVLKYHMFHLIENGEIIPMSKRAGTIVTVGEILEKIDLNYLKWIILSYNNNKVIKFDFHNISVDNPIFTLQYVLMRMDQLQIDHEKQDSDMTDIYRRCIFWPIELRTGAKNLDTHKILQYTFILCDLIKKFLDSIIANTVSKNDFYILEKCKYILNIAIKIMDLKL